MRVQDVVRLDLGDLRPSGRGDRHRAAAGRGGPRVRRTHIGGAPRSQGCRSMPAPRAGDRPHHRLHRAGAVDFAGARYELLDGQAEPHPAYTSSRHPATSTATSRWSSRATTVSVVLAGQSHDTASHWSADVLATRARSLGQDALLPEPGPWVARLLAFDPKRVVFAHDAAVWVP